MKKLPKIIVMLLAFILTVSAFSACVHKNDGQKIDPERTQLYIHNVDGGYGQQYLQKIIERFEESVKDESFETGKKGVQVMVTPLKGHITEDALKAGEFDLFYSDEAYTLQNWISKGLVLDITDVATKKLTDYDEEKSIKDKFYPGTEAMYGQNGKIYALPGFIWQYGISYNVELFEEHLLYFKDGGGFITDLSDTKAAGPDGELGTYDDGLPATYDDFFKMCDKMVYEGLQPICWNGTYKDWYLENVLQALQADAAGLEQMMLNYTFDGTATSLVSGFDAQNKPILKEPTVITNANGYEMFTQAAMYYATYFMDRIVSNTDYYDYNKQFGTYSHLEAQNDFLTSQFTTARDICMLFEGIHWEQEMSEYGTYAQMEKKYGPSASRANRKIAFMPFPKPTAEMVTGTNRNTILDTSFGVRLIPTSIKAEKIELAKRFLQFTYTDESLKETTATNSTYVGVKYDFTSENASHLSYFGKSINNLMNSGRTDVGLAFSSNALYSDNVGSFTAQSRYFSKIGNTSIPHILTDLQKPNGFSSIEIFNGYLNYRNENGKWANTYSKYIVA